MTNNEHYYKTYCETNNTLDDSWDTIWATLIQNVRDSTNKETAYEIINAFVTELRENRHLTNIRNNREDIMERTDRKRWHANTVLQLYKKGNMDTFRAWTHEFAASVSEPLWNSFMESLNTAATDEDRITLISKFMTSQRKKKYNRSHK